MTEEAMKFYVASTNPDTYTHRRAIGKLLSELMATYVGYVVKMHDVRSDLVQDVTHYSSMNVASYSARLQECKDLMEASGKEFMRTMELAVDLDLVPAEVMSYRGMCVQTLMHKLENMARTDWILYRQSRRMPAGITEENYKSVPIRNNIVWRYFRYVKAVCPRIILDMFVSQEEQGMEIQKAEEAFTAYELQYNAISDRTSEVRHMPETDLIILYQDVINANPGVKFPKAKYGRADYNKGYLTSNSKDDIVKAIVNAEFPSNIVLGCPAGYKAWKDAKIKKQNAHHKFVNQLIIKRVNEGDMESAIQLYLHEREYSPEVDDPVEIEVMNIVFSYLSEEERKSRIIEYVKSDKEKEAVFFYKKFFHGTWLKKEEVLGKIQEWVEHGTEGVTELA